jgi:ribosomal protein L37AE/L43A
VDENVAPANSDALGWYRTAKQRHPGKFPTDSVSFSTPASGAKISWRTIADSPGKTEVQCTGCGKRLSVPSGKKGLAKCPACGTSFTVGS